MLINLHSHLEGRLRPTTAAELGAQLGLPGPAGGWGEALQLTGPADLTVYLAKVAASYPFFADADHLARIASEAVQDAAADGLDYLELRFGPATHVRPNLPMDAVVRAVCEGVRDGSARSGMPAGVVVAMLRNHDPDTNLEVARAASSAAGEGVVGFDLAGDEILYPDLAPFAAAYAIARSAGLGLTCHAAEAGPAPAAREAVDLLGVSRIGHGAHIMDDPATLAWAAESGIVIEICPTSNWFTGAIRQIADHPAATFREHGVAMVLGDDNPIQTRSGFSAEHALLGAELGFTTADLAALDRTSVAAAFLEPSERAALSALL
jgi:adenosine deaminase